MDKVLSSLYLLDLLDYPDFDPRLLQLSRDGAQACNSVTLVFLHACFLGWRHVKPQNID